MLSRISPDIARWPMPGVALLLLFASGLLGCSNGEEPCYPVRGQVVYEDGQPAVELVNGSIALIPDREGGTPIASGTIGDDGRFVLSTRREKDGAVAGPHRVAIELPDLDSMDGDARHRQPPRVRLDRDALDNLRVTVEPKSNELTITVKRATKGKKPSN